MTTVTQFIKDNLKARIQAESPLPYRLTLADISRYYGVSLMPVRQAINDLVEEQVILRKENGRLDVKNKPLLSGEAKAFEDIDLEQPKASLIKAITNDVIRLSLMQNTEYLREEATASKHGVGRTMVRQIFTQLSAEGIMEHIPRCGWRVKPYREEDMLDYLDIREMLEIKSLKLAYPHLDKAEMQALLELNRPEAGTSTPRLDNTLHAYWVKHCANRYIIEFFTRYGEYYEQIFNYAVLDQTMKQDMADEHCSIIESLLEGDLDSALEQLSQHIRDQRRNISEVITFLQVKS